MAKRIVVAIDGPAGAGKSTIAQRLAARLGFIYIDTGAMYRAVALWAMRAGVEFSELHRLEQLAAAAQIAFRPGGGGTFLNGEDITDVIRAPEMSDAASKISTVSGVRRELVLKQRAMAATTSVVMEGRDIGTVVFPDAEVKVFLDADSRIRAERRTRELTAKGRSVDLTTVSKEIEERDRRDRGRSEAPLMQAPDAVYIDTSGLTLEQVEEEILKVVRQRTSNGKELHTLE
ncbi:MAG: (d)CMP kinase [Acidobacteria bacterium]|nr:(d)CMP kinase [Acidobacteriota bacterium]